MLPALSKPWSIMRRTAMGRLSVAVEDAASASSQATNRPRWARTNGHSVRRVPIRAFAVAGVLSGSSLLAMRAMLSARSHAAFRQARWSRARRSRARRSGAGEADPVARGVAQLCLQVVDAIGGQAQSQVQAIGVEAFVELVRAVRRDGGMQEADVVKADAQFQFAHRDQRAPRRDAQA